MMRGFIRRSTFVLAPSLLALVGAMLLLSASVLAAGDATEAACPNEQLHVENASVGLPDCRAYEQVTPAGPYNSEFNGVSPDGSTVLFASSGGLAGLPLDDNNGNEAVRIFGSHLSEAGWTLGASTDFAEQVGHNYPLLGSSADGSRLIVVSATSETPEGVYPATRAINLFETSPMSPPLLLSRDEDGDPLTGGNEMGLAGPIVVSADGTHVVFSSGTSLTRAATEAGGGPYLYESNANGAISLVSIASDGQLPSPDGGAGLGSTRPGEHEGHGIIANAVSADGSTVYFNSQEQYDPTAPGGMGAQLFMHRDGATIDVSKGIEEASFDGASSDGAEVVFSGDHGNIYYFDSVTDTLEVVSHGEPEVNAYLAMSADGTHVYFATEQQLSPEAPPAETGRPDLYQWVGGHVTYIATLSRADVELLQSATRVRPFIESNGLTGQQTEVGASALGPIRVTANGAYLVFESTLPLTADDHNTEAGRINVYEYTSENGLVRVSQGSLPGSGNGRYSATIGSWHLPEPPDFANGGRGEEPPFTFGTSQDDGRALTESGAVFFSSREALATGAANGPLHVYEWKGGKTYLISLAGPEATDAHYLENSADGSSVYFSTTQAVLPTDTNGGWVNIWDARVDGGLPTPAQANPCAQNECPVSPPVARNTPLSTTFSGPADSPLAANPPPVLAATETTKSQAGTRALANALRTCRTRNKKKRRRSICEKTARKKYGPKIVTKKRGITTAQPKKAVKG
jgi:hypothetical protein